MDEMRAILDSLMGADRNSVAAMDGGSKATFKSSDVCHFYLLDFCPHDLFPNTKSDLGPCPKKHSDAFREQFLADPEHDYYARRYEREFIDSLQRLVDSVEQRIRKGNERILGPDESRLEQDKQRKVDALKKEISQLLVQAQEAGEKGNIAEAEALTRKTTEVRCSLDRLNSTSTNYLASLSAQEKSLRVCPICGAMQSLGDAASRFESHVTGKQHVGYERIRATLAALRAKHGLQPTKNGVRSQLTEQGAASRAEDQTEENAPPLQGSGSDDAAQGEAKSGALGSSRPSMSQPKRSLSRSRSPRNKSSSYSRHPRRRGESSLSRESLPDRSHRSSRYSSHYRDSRDGKRDSRRYPSPPSRRSSDYSHSRSYHGGSRHRSHAYGDNRYGDSRYEDYRSRDRRHNDYSSHDYYSPERRSGRDGRSSGMDRRAGDYRSSHDSSHKKHRRDMSNRKLDDTYDSKSPNCSRSRGRRRSESRDRSAEKGKSAEQDNSQTNVSQENTPSDRA